MMSEVLRKILSEGKDIAINSKEVKEGTIFIAMQGLEFDGRDYINEAIKKGASAIIYEATNFKEKKVWDIPSLAIHNLKQELPEIAGLFYQNPTKSLKVIGVTGTNGKTSVVGWLQQCLSNLHQNAGLIGTLGSGKGHLEKTSNTTPDIISLNKIFYEFKKKGIQYAAMEVSSHAIKQNRIANIVFDIKVLTNVTRDHLDYHKTLSNYQKTKKQFFSDGGCKNFVLNVDDHVGQQLVSEIDWHEKNLITYAIDNQADLCATNIVYKDGMMIFDLLHKDKIYNLRANVFGKHNAYNLLSVIACLVMYKFSINSIIEAVQLLQSIQGRNEVIQFNSDGSPQVVIDYAHTPDALENILVSLKTIAVKNVILLFGCGGNRDKGKRKKMALVANKYADKIIITTDNPRHEDPSEIINDILKHITTRHIVIESREQAIKAAVEMLSDDSLLLIAGKGHEEYQEVKGIRYPFSDKEIALLELGNIKN